MSKCYPAKRSHIAKDRDAVVMVESVEDPAFVQRGYRTCPVCNHAIETGQRIAGDRHSVCANEGGR